MSDFLLMFVCCLAGFFWGTQAKHLISMWHYSAEALIWKLWNVLGVDSIKCHGGELVFVEEIEIKGGADNAE